MSQRRSSIGPLCRRKQKSAILFHWECAMIDAVMVAAGQPAALAAGSRDKAMWDAGM